MTFQKGNKLGGGKKGHPCYNKEQLANSKWMMRGAEQARISSAEIKKYLADGWIFGRPAASEETRRKQSEAGKKANNPTHWKPGHRTWNHGDKMPESACIAMSIGKLAKYGITEEQVVVARRNEMSWCSHHLRFEPNTAFTVLKNGRRATRCNECHNKYTPWYKGQFATQQGLCAICGEVEPRLEAMSVDHAHNCPNPKHTRKHEPMIGCECSRGLLCSLCNPKLGYFEGFLKTVVSSQFAEGSWEKKAFDYLKSFE